MPRSLSRQAKGSFKAMAVWMALALTLGGCQATGLNTSGSRGDSANGQSRRVVRASVAPQIVEEGREGDGTAPKIEDLEGMVKIPEGEFWMGSSPEEMSAAFEMCKEARGEGKCLMDWFSNEWPRRRVWLKGYWIDKHEVTVEEYGRCVQARGCSAPKSTKEGEAYNWEASDRGEHPSTRSRGWHEFR